MHWCVFFRLNPSFRFQFVSPSRSTRHTCCTVYGCSHRPVRMEEQERVSNVLVESVWVGSCPGLLYRLFLNAHPFAYCGVSSLGHSGSQFGPISCTHAARFAQNQRMIALRPARKNRESGGGMVEKWKTEIGWHVQPSLLEFKGLACVQF